MKMLPRFATGSLNSWMVSDMKFGSFLKFDGIVTDNGKKSMVGLISWRSFLGIGVDENNVHAYTEITHDQAAQMYEFLGAFLMGETEDE